MRFISYMNLLKRVYIITGTSSGIGKALAEALLQRGDFVYGIARSNSTELQIYERYEHLHFDLSVTQQIEGLIVPLLERIAQEEPERICLVNNAAMAEPLLPIELCETEQVTANIHISLIAPMILTSQFIKKTQNWHATRQIVNISSASAVYASPAMSVYSTAKAGLDMFTRCVGREQKQQDDPVEILSIHPGMVDTAMQQLARSKSKEHFAMSDYFLEAYRNGELISTGELVKHLFRLMEGKYEPGSILQYSDE